MRPNNNNEEKEQAPLMQPPLGPQELRALAREKREEEERLKEKAKEQAELAKKVCLTGAAISAVVHCGPGVLQAAPTLLPNLVISAPIVLKAPPPCLSIFAKVTCGVSTLLSAAEYTASLFSKRGANAAHEASMQAERNANDAARRAPANFAEENKHEDGNEAGQRFAIN